MARVSHSRSMISAWLPSFFAHHSEHASYTATDTPLQSMFVFGYGRFQKLVLLCAQVTTFVAYCYSFSVTTDLEPVNHACQLPPGREYFNMSIEAWMNATIPRSSSDPGVYDSCHRYEQPLTEVVPTAGLEDGPKVVRCDVWDYDTRLTGRTVFVYWNMVCHRAWYQQLASAAYMCGGALSVPCAGLASNRWGRRPVMWVSLCVLLCSGVATCVVPTVATFLVLRFVSSAAVSALEVVAYVLLFESTPPGPREPFCALAVCWPTALAPMYVAGVAFLALDWRICHMSLVAPALALIWTVYVTEESPHWLLVNLRFAEARRVAVWAARLNDEDVEVVIERLEKVKDILTTAGSASGQCHRSDAQHALPGYFSSRTMLAHCFVIFGCWFLLYVTYYYRNLDNSTPHIAAVKWVVIVGNVPSMTIAYFIVKRHGRLTPLVVFLLTVALLLLFQTAIRFFDLFFPPQLGLMWRALLLNIAYVLLCVHTVVLFPTQVRSVAFSGAYTFGRLGAITSQVFRTAEASLPQDLQALPMGVASVSLLMFSLLLLTLPEKTLEDIVSQPDDRSAKAL